MGNLIRRNKAIPVQTRRVEPDPAQIAIPSAGPVSQVPIPPASQPTVSTTNIFYISQPAPVSAPPAMPTVPTAPPPPTEVHYHTAVHHAPRREQRKKSISYFGMMSICSGALAIAGSYSPMLAPYAVRSAEVGIIAGATGWLGAILLQRTGVVAPIFGLILSATGWLFATGHIAAPKIDAPAAPASVGSAAPKPPVQLKPTPAPAESKSIFELADEGKIPSPAITSPIQTPIDNVKPAAIDLGTAAANLERARVDAAKRLQLDYTGAKVKSEELDAELKAARKSYGLASPELIAAGQRRMDADSALHRIESQLHTDPAVAAAERADQSASPKSSNR